MHQRSLKLSLATNNNGQLYLGRKGESQSAGTGAQQTKIVDKLVKSSRDDTERHSRFSTGI